MTEKLITQIPITQSYTNRRIVPLAKRLPRRMKCHREIGTH